MVLPMITISLYSQKQTVKFFDDLGVYVKLNYEKDDFYTNDLYENVTILYVGDEGFGDKWKGIKISGNIDESDYKMRIYHDVGKNVDLLNMYFQSIDPNTKFKIVSGYVGEKGKYINKGYWCEIPLPKNTENLIVSDSDYDKTTTKSMEVKDTPGRLVGNHPEVFTNDNYITTIVEIVDGKKKVQYRGVFILTNQNLWNNY
jgi:hypothetical protein